MKKPLFVFLLFLFFQFQLKSQSWKQLNDIGTNTMGSFVPNIPGNAASFTVSGKIFVVAGSSASLGNTNKCYQFDQYNKVWIGKNNFPDSVGSPVSFVINNIAYVGSGYSNSIKKVSNLFWKYNETNDSWTSIAPMPASRNVAVGFSINNLGYVGLGTDSTNNHQRKEFFSYNPLTNKWSNIANFGGTERNSACAFVLNNKAYVGLGINGSVSNIFQDFWKYNPDLNNWTQVAVYPGTARYRALSFVINNNPFVGLGIGYNFSGQFNDFYKYNDTTNSWQAIQGFPFGLDFAIALSDGKQAFVGKGVSGQVSNIKMFAYNIDSNTWTFFKENFGVNRAASFNINNKIYVIGGQGYDQSLNSQMWEFDPAKNNWTAKINFPGVPRIYGHKGFVIGNEGFLIGGTSTSMNALSDCWKYNALTNKWDSIAPLPIPRNDACTFTLNNKGYVVSGTPNQSNLLNDCWEYNPILNSWILKDSLPADPRKFATSFSLNNNAYIVGGINHFGTPMNEVWAYNALTEKWIKKNNINAEGIYAALGTSTSNAAYICMGKGNDNINFFKEIRTYNQVLDTWNTLTLFPTIPTIFGIAESINNKIYLGLGANVLNNSIASFYELDPFGSVGIFADMDNTKQSFAIESPFTNTAKLFFKNVVKGKYEINIFDVFGKLLSKNNINIIDNMNGEMDLLDTEYLKNGLYYIIINGSNYQQYFKILKTN